MSDNPTWNGYPPDPDKSGWHWLRHGMLTPAYWAADNEKWHQGGLLCGGSADPKFLAAHNVGYFAPCVVPHQRPARPRIPAWVARGGRP